MKKINQAICVALMGVFAIACSKNKGADSPSDGPAEEAGEDLDEATEDIEESVEEAGEEMEDAADEVGDEMDGDPTTE